MAAFPLFPVPSLSTARKRLSENPVALDAFSKSTLTRLALVAIFLTLVDNVQSYYGQKVINVFSEFNAIPAFYYRQGLIGYILYAPIEFCVVYAVMLVLWFWASYVMWYHRNIISRSRIFARKPIKF